MLLSAVIALTPRADVTLPPALGRAAHAVLLELVRAVDPELGAALHADEPVKPFTAGFLEEGAAAGARQTVCRAGRRYHLRFTALDARLTTLLEERVLPHLPASVRVDDGEFAVEGVATDTAAHPWAGRQTYRALAERYLVARAAPPGQIELAFAAPTTFRSRGRHVPLPLPDLVFGSLLDRWNAFAPVRLEESLRAWAGEALALSHYRLESRLVAVSGGKQVAFVGSCTYRVLAAEPHLLRQVHLLADYAFYSGVGHKTTMGLGRTHRVPRADPGRGTTARPHRAGDVALNTSSASVSAADPST